MENFSKKIKTIFQLQEAMNCKVNPNWREAKNEWYRAAWIESAELAEHHHFKWWKNTNQEVNQEQAGLELVDILHFLVSDMLEMGIEPEELEHSIKLSYRKIENSTKKEKLLAIDKFAAHCATYESIGPNHFCELVGVLGFDMDWILNWYIGKNVLNIFRQDHGYKEGTYIKIWNGQEDNEYLAAIINSGESDFERIYDALENCYPKCQ